VEQNKMNTQNPFNELITKALNLQLFGLQYRRAVNQTLNENNLSVNSTEYQEFATQVTKLIAEKKAIRKTKFEAANGDYNIYADTEYKQAGKQIKALEMLVQ
jgi:hypothetical protein